MIPSAKTQSDSSTEQESELSLVEPSLAYSERPVVRGKFLFAGNEKLWVKGVTYGTFRPGEDGSQFPDQETVQRDFAMMLFGPPDPWKTEPFFACCTDGFRPVVFKVESIPTTQEGGTT